MNAQSTLCEEARARGPALSVVQLGRLGANPSSGDDCTGAAPSLACVSVVGGMLCIEIRRHSPGRPPPARLGVLRNDELPFTVRVDCECSREWTDLSARPVRADLRRSSPLARRVPRLCTPARTGRGRPAAKGGCSARSGPTYRTSSYGLQPDTRVLGSIDYGVSQNLDDIRKSHLTLCGLTVKLCPREATEVPPSSQLGRQLCQEGNRRRWAEICW